MSILVEMGHKVFAYNRGEKRRQAVKEKYGVSTFDSIDEALEKNIDAAFVCSPNSLHVEHAFKVTEKGVNLFIEKPLSHNNIDLSKLSEVIESKNLICHVGSNMRFHFGPRQVKSILDEGKIGRPLWASVWGAMSLPHWHPEEDYRQMYSASQSLGGGALLDFIHEIDLIRWIFGSPKEVFGLVNNSGHLEIETEDLVDAIFSYENFQLSLHIDYLQWPFQRGIKIVGSKGWVCWDLAQKKVAHFDNKSDSIVDKMEPEDNNMYREQLEYFIDCLQASKPSDSDFNSGWKALEIVEKIKESSENKKIIHIN